MHEFRIDGPALREGVPIHIAVAALKKRELAQHTAKGTETSWPERIFFELLA